MLGYGVLFFASFFIEKSSAQPITFEFYQVCEQATVKGYKNPEQELKCKTAFSFPTPYLFRCLNEKAEPSSAEFTQECDRLFQSTMMMPQIDSVYVPWDSTFWGPWYHAELPKLQKVEIMKLMPQTYAVIGQMPYWQQRKHMTYLSLEQMDVGHKYESEYDLCRTALDNNQSEDFAKTQCARKFHMPSLPVVQCMKEIMATRGMSDSCEKTFQENKSWGPWYDYSFSWPEVEVFLEILWRCRHGGKCQLLQPTS